MCISSTTIWRTKALRNLFLGPTLVLAPEQLILKPVDQLAHFQFHYNEVPISKKKNCFSLITQQACERSSFPFFLVSTIFGFCMRTFEKGFIHFRHITVNSRIARELLHFFCYSKTFGIYSECSDYSSYRDHLNIAAYE